MEGIDDVAEDYGEHRHHDPGADGTHRSQEHEDDVPLRRAPTGESKSARKTDMKRARRRGEGERDQKPRTCLLE